MKCNMCDGTYPCNYCIDSNLANQGVKYDQGKPRMSLILTQAVVEVAKVGTMGATKYNDQNWRQGMKWSRLLDAALRHLTQYNNGDRIDKESGLSHLSHAAWNVLALLDYELNTVGEDDLFRGYNHKTKQKETTNMSFVYPRLARRDDPEE